MTPPSVTRPLDDDPCTLRLTFDSGSVMWADMPRSEAEALLAALSRADPYALVPVPGTSRRVAPAHIAVWELEDAPSVDALFGGSLRTARARPASCTVHGSPAARAAVHGSPDDADEEGSA